MKFLEWEDFVKVINDYGRLGYIKKRTTFNPFTKVNTMIMEHKTRHNEVIFILYPDEESYDLDWTSEVYVRPPTRSKQFLNDMQKKTFEPKIDRRTRENRSNNYPEKPGTKKEETKLTTSPQPKPKPGPPRKKDDQK